MFSDLKLHHNGCLVNNIEEFKSNNKLIWDETDYSDVFYIRAQDVSVCFIKNKTGSFLELVEPGATNHTLSRMLEKGIINYHLGYITSHYSLVIERCKQAGLHHVSEFNSEAFQDMRCSFFYHFQLGLIEIIEDEEDKKN
jgi:hypothetical protein